jgi:hypothetical protein
VIMSRLYPVINLELIIGIAIPVLNIIWIQNIFCPGTERYIWMISQVPAQGGLFFASCSFISDSFLLGFDFLDCFWFSWFLVHLTLVTKILWDPNISSLFWIPLHIIRGIPS